MRVASIDCGTNATRLLVADSDGEAVTEVVRRLVITRMGAGVDAQGRIGPEALDRVGAALRGYAATCAELGVERTAVLATSAARDATNTDDLRALVRDALGVEAEVLTGDEEAAATYRGAVADIDLPGATLVVDLGGGSTEFAIRHDGSVRTCSLPVGSVRLRERLLHHDPVTVPEVLAAAELVDASVAELADRLPLGDVGSVVAVGGTALVMAALARGVTDADDHALHGAALDAAAMRQVAEDLLWAPSTVLARLPQISAGREDVIGVGAFVLARVVARLGIDGFTASRHDLLDDRIRRAVMSGAGERGGG